jgi:hypothetical protein
MAGRTREQNSAELEDWRVDDLGRKRGETNSSRPAPSPRKSQSRPRKSSEWLPATGGKRRRAARSNGGGNGRAGIDELRRRAAKLERELREELRRAREEIAKLRSQLREQGAPISPTGRLDANAASFEQLRELGLTPAQCAKLIARRESAGRFKAKADLRRIPGLSKSARELVEKRLSVRR